MPFLNKLLRKIIPRVNSNKPFGIFIPQNQLCAVDKTYAILIDQNTSRFSNIFYLYSFSEVTINPDLFTKQKQEKVIVFAHYSPTWSNVRTYNNEFCNIDWSVAFSAKSLWFGHICFGGHLFERFNIQNWVSYTGNISSIFGNPKIEERFVLFLKNAITIVQDSNNIQQVYNQIIDLYNDEILFLKKNKNENYEYELILPYVYANMLSVRVCSQVVTNN